MSCKLIALDLDGTLLRDDLTISPKVLESLGAARDRGIQLTLASGRSYASMRRWIEELDIVTPVISYQGAAVTDPLTHRCLYQHTFPLGLVVELAAFARERQLSLTLYANDVIYVERKMHPDSFYDAWFGLPYRVVGDLPTALPAPAAKFIIIGEGEDLDHLQPEVEHLFGQRMQIMRSHRLFLEGLALGVTKGTALEWLAGQLGIARQDTMAIGDSGNDEAMIAWAGMGVAMGNASSEALAAADYVAPSVEEDGVADAIERFCLLRCQDLYP